MASLTTGPWSQVPGSGSQEPESILRQILVQPLGLQRCTHFPEVAQLAAESVALCFQDLSHQLILPSHSVLGHVLVAPCKLKADGAAPTPDKPPTTQVAATVGSALPPVTTRVRPHATCGNLPGCCTHQLSTGILVAHVTRRSLMSGAHVSRGHASSAFD